MKRTGRALGLFLVAALMLGACDGGGGAPTPSRRPSPTTAPTPAQTFTGAPGTAIYEYANEGLSVTLDLDASAGTLLVENDSSHDLDAPDLYVLDAVDGHEIDADVLDAVPVAAGERATFDVTLDDITSDDIGLLVLLIGAANYGAFVRTG